MEGRAASSTLITISSFCTSRGKAGHLFPPDMHNIIIIYFIITRYYALAAGYHQHYHTATRIRNIAA
jgi:hypothetical protein